MMMNDPWLLGIEIGGTKLQVGLGRKAGVIEALERRVVDPARGAEGVRDLILDAAAPLLARAEVRGVGVGFGGPVDAEKGRTQASFQIDGWDDYPLADWVRRNLGVDAVALHNDADAAGLAEARLGAGVGRSPVLYLTIGSGIGGALIIDGRIYRGAGLGAAEIGHLRVPPPERGSPREFPELEQIASGWGITRLAKAKAAEVVAGGEDWEVLDAVDGDVQRITTVMIAQAAERGDPRSLALLEVAHRALAFALCQAVALAAPRRIILGGGVSLIGDRLWFDPIRRLVDAQVFPPFRQVFDIVPAALGEEVVVHGALEIARDAVG